MTALDLTPADVRVVHATYPGASDAMNLLNREHAQAVADHFETKVRAAIIAELGDAISQARTDIEDRAADTGHRDPLAAEYLDGLGAAFDIIGGAS